LKDLQDPFQSTITQKPQNTTASTTMAQQGDKDYTSEVKKIFDNNKEVDIVIKSQLMNGTEESYSYFISGDSLYICTAFWGFGGTTDVVALKDIDFQNSSMNEGSNLNTIAATGKDAPYIWIKMLPGKSSPLIKQDSISLIKIGPFACRSNESLKQKRMTKTVPGLLTFKLFRIQKFSGWRRRYSLVSGLCILSC